MSNQVLIEDGALKGIYPSLLWGEYLHLEGAQAVGTFASDYYAGRPALTVNRYGEGQAWYLATRSSPDLLTKLLYHLSQEAHVEPILAVPTGVEVSRRRRSDGQLIYFVLNHTAEGVRLTLPTGTFRSLLDEREVSGEIELAARESLVLLA
jgi:beta-galactosidase